MGLAVVCFLVAVVHLGYAAWMWDERSNGQLSAAIGWYMAGVAYVSLHFMEKARDFYKENADASHQAFLSLIKQFSPWTKDEQENR